MSVIDIPAGEQGRIRVFALSMTPIEAQALRDDDDTAGGAQSLRQDVLGAQTLDPDRTEVFAVADLDGVGLPDYLITGHGAQAAEIEADRVKLAALDGWVMIALSPAFGGAAQTLTPDPRLTLIGTYGQPGTDWRATETVTSEAAKPYSAPPETAKKK
ncbi:MAG: hypothetical protein AAFO58_11545, partial [Pseudomonadota bacterium]